MTYPATPELNKMVAISNSGKSDIVQQFIEWLLDDQDYTLANWNAEEGLLYDVNPNREELMRKFFKIDSRKVETERDAVLQHIRENQEKKEK